MLVLGVETATQLVGVAVGRPEGMLASFHSTRERRHAETLAPAIDFVCRQAQIDLDEIDAIAVDVGPGSFTGLRIGLATAKAIAYARRIPMAGFCSLDLLAHRARIADRVILSLIDARRGELYYALYRRASSGDLQRIAEPAVAPPAEIAAQLKNLDEGCLVVGDGVERYAHLFGEAGPIERAGKGFRFPSADSLVEMGAAMAARGELVPESEIQPLYLRPPDAKAAW
jgi:tRNA threonylcarbamoyladenosine biosynthesis protein TsaB